MDSFYDQPRDAPKPTNINKLSGPLIPDVSIIQQPVTNVIRQGVRHQPFNVESYNVWKARNVSDKPHGNKENFNPHYTNRQFNDPNVRKHVRFESPTLRRTNSNPCPVPSMQNKNVGLKPLEEIYMANIPNRNLDLSVLELPTNTRDTKFNSYDKNCYDIYNYKRVTENVQQINEDQNKKEQPEITKQPNTYADFKKLKSGDDFKKQINEPFYSRDLYNKLTNDDYRYDYASHDNRLVTRRESDEPTTRDLLKVIQQQNEQILLLQKQVACLLETKANQNEIEDVNYDLPPPSNSPLEQEKYKKLKKGPLSKIAIDVMTSFEVSFRRQNQNLQRGKLKEIDDSPKIQEVTNAVNGVNNVLDGIKKNDKFDANDDVSLSLQESLKVVERCPSPDQSIHVEMQDYSSDEEDSDLGWTLYNNIMGQVNNIFQNAQTDMQQGEVAHDNLGTVKDKRLDRVKEATMKHLKSVGVNLPLIKENDDSTESTKKNDAFNSSDVSFAVKQLLMKYLPNEQLAKLTCNEVKRVQPNENLIKRRPDFSFATVQYMKKYNLLSSDCPKGQLPVKAQTNCPKILDVTALKQQPKLL